VDGEREFLMAMKWLGRIMAGAAVILAGAGTAEAAKCGNDAGGYAAWVDAFSAEAKAAGIKPNALKALQGTSYATKTIWADRNQKSFKLSFEQFMAKRGAPTIMSRGVSAKRSNAGLFSSIEKKYGVPAGPLIAIWQMETGGGSFMGNQNTLSAVATLAYDCRRSDYFTTQLYAMLKLIERGSVSGSTTGAMHGEIGQTQFLPANVLKYGVDGDGDGRIDLKGKADALASTANFLRGHGWRAGAGYQPGEPNFAALQGWNAAGVYQKAIAVIGKHIDDN
jgi:lytic murein transglycosylase